MAACQQFEQQPRITQYPQETSLCAADSTQAPVPNFSGRWRLRHIDGDVEPLLVDAGVGWALRKLAKSMNYGLGKQTQDIQQTGDDFIVVMEGGPRVTTMKFRMGAGAQKTVGLDGNPVTVNPWWDGQACMMTMGKPAGVSTPRPLARYFLGSEMVIEATTSDGRAVKRFFANESQTLNSQGPVCEEPMVAFDECDTLSEATTTDTILPVPFGVRTDVRDELAEPILCADQNDAFEELPLLQGQTTLPCVPHLPDFSSRWRLCKIDGEMELFLVDSGVGWAQRKMAKALNYGLGKQIQDIQQTGDDFIIVTEGGPRVTTMKFRMGAGKQETQGPDGNSIIVDPLWDGHVCKMSMSKYLLSRDMFSIPLFARYFLGSEMVVEATTSKGHIVKRFFVNESTESPPQVPDMPTMPEVVVLSPVAATILDACDVVRAPKATDVPMEERSMGVPLLPGEENASEECLLPLRATVLLSSPFLAPVDQEHVQPTDHANGPRWCYCLQRIFGNN